MQLIGVFREDIVEFLVEVCEKFGKTRINPPRIRGRQSQVTAAADSMMD